MALGRPPASAPGEVHGAHVLLVGVRETRPGVHRRPVDVQPVGMGGGHVGGGARHGAGGRGDLGADVGDPVGLLRVSGRAQPVGGCPVALTQGRGEVCRSRDRTPARIGAAGLDGPAVGGVRRERRASVRDEGLRGGIHRGRLPYRAAQAGIGASEHNAEGRLCGVPPAGLQHPGELAVVGVDPHRVREPVDRERGGAQTTGPLGCCVERPGHRLSCSGLSCRSERQCPAGCGDTGATPAEEARKVRRPKRLTTGPPWPA